MQDKLEIKIPFYDVDPMQVVWHGNYIKYMEQGRCALLEKINLTYVDMEKSGYLFPVVSLQVKYMRPCVFGQEVVLTTTLKNCENLLIFTYLLTDKKSGQKLMQAETRQMGVEMKTKESLFTLPDICLKKIKEMGE